MTTAGASIEDMIASIEGLPRALIRDAGPDLAVAIRADLVRTINAYETPDGELWAKRKRGTAPVLVKAEDALRVVAVGPQIFIRLIGVEARHHRGRVKGGTQRQIIPTDHIPVSMATAMRDVLTRHFTAAVTLV